MKQLDPYGNVFQRIQACWYLFFYPKAFVAGVLNEFCNQVSAHVQAHMATLPDPFPDKPSPELAARAETAQSEAING